MGLGQLSIASSPQTPEDPVVAPGLAKSCHLWKKCESLTLTPSLPYRAAFYSIIRTIFLMNRHEEVFIPGCSIY
ncbi:hypothetical protein [Methylacidiphilum caldifontis]|uniref:Uncharacterized protein n=1 Tax=Methylacidiphilum caldifontis TaxID=2795386 RepID=A0A4Y8PJ06_9BACT|nr:hypothetical protein [Methylacidiphilum caldifontis]QSR88477.1 hypothetical protein IT6_08910 [Methylacidiphilum caldifontis]TFE71305.1 hypothetical protein A7Q10_04850 [Methylacidiphilum caldifontis]